MKRIFIKANLSSYENFMVTGDINPEDIVKFFDGLTKMKSECIDGTYYYWPDEEQSGLKAIEFKIIKEEQMRKPTEEEQEEKKIKYLTSENETKAERIKKLEKQVCALEGQIEMMVEERGGEEIELPNETQEIK